MVLLLHNPAGTYLLLALLLNNYLRVCDSIPTEGAQIFTSENETRPEVTIAQGTVQGVNMVTHNGRKIVGFRGIPFAQPPVGNLRFKRPVAAEPWNGTWDASNDPTPCPQFIDSGVIGNEDCLYLNVYTPWLPVGENSTLLPVMVYIFGGAHRKGSVTSTQWGPYFLLEKNVVLVVPSYRLGLLGYFSTGDEVSPGNYGLKDIVQALEWTRDNIQFFGGDPSQVTLAGGSSGAMSVHLLTLSNLTNGLFHRYITQSGSALSPEAQRPREEFANRAIQVGKYLGCSTNSSIALITCLRGIDISQLVKSYSAFHIWEGTQASIWVPTVEPDIEGALLTDTAANLFAIGKIRDLPWLCLFTKNEAVWYQAKLYKKVNLHQDFLRKIDIILPFLLGYDISVDNVTACNAALKSYYLNDMTADRNLLLNNFTQLMRDGYYYYPMYSALQQYLVHAKSPVYLGSFQYRGTFSYSYSLTGGDTVNWGSVHGDECLYLFEASDRLYGPREYKMNEADWRMVDTMIELWTSFVINGIPTAANQTSTIIWEPHSTHKSYLQIGSDSNVSFEVKYNFFEDHAQFWEELTASNLCK